MLDRLDELYEKYKNLKTAQSNFNYHWVNKPLKYKGGLKWLDDGYDFKFDFIDFAENGIQISFMSDADGTTDECVEWLTVGEFKKHFEVLK